MRVQSFETFFEMEPKLGIFNRVLHRLNYNRFSKTSDFCRFTHFKNFKISSFKKSVVVQFWDRTVGTLVSKNWPAKNKSDPTKLSRNWQTITEHAISGQVGWISFIREILWMMKFFKFSINGKVFTCFIDLLLMIICLVYVYIQFIYYRRFIIYRTYLGIFRWNIRTGVSVRLSQN